MNKEKRISTGDMANVAMFAAVMSVMSQISIPLPGGVPVTLQTFGAALTGYMLGAKKGAGAIVIYVLLGAVGVPVFAGFHGGFGSVAGQLGGFIWGFIPMAFLCGLGADLSRRMSAGGDGAGKLTGKAAPSAVLAIILGIAGLSVCHVCGIMQWTVVRGGGVFGSFLTVSAPFLLKDAVSTAAAYFVSLAVAKRVRTANC